MSEVPSELKCPVCRMLYKDPYKLLSCGHHVCLQCLKNLVFPVGLSGEEMVKFECPVAECQWKTHLSLKTDDSQVEIDFEESVELAPDPCLGRITDSFVQLEEKFERERIDKVEKERTIKELQMNIGHTTETGYLICNKHSTQGMELNLYCIPCDTFLCHFCAVKPHKNHPVIAASSKEEYLEKKGIAVKNLKNAQLCVDVIASEVREKHKVVKKYEETVSPISDRLHQVKAVLNEAFEKARVYYTNLEENLKMAMTEAKEPLVDASDLLKQLVEEISSQNANVENGLIRKFEESNKKLASLQQRKLKECSTQISSAFQQVEVKLNRMKKVADDVNSYIAKCIVDLQGEETGRIDSVNLESDSDTAISSSMEVNASTPVSYENGERGISQFDTRDVNDGLICSRTDVEKRAYIVSLGLGPRVVSPVTDTVDQGVQCAPHDLDLLLDCGIQTIPQESESQAEIFESRKRRRSENSTEYPTTRGKTCRSSADDTTEEFETPNQTMDKTSEQDTACNSETNSHQDQPHVNSTDLNYEADLDDSFYFDQENVDPSFEFRCLSVDPDKLSPGRFVLVSHENEKLFPWIGKIIKCHKKTLTVEWFCGKLNQRWKADSNMRLDKVSKDTVHASFSFDAEKLCFMSAELSHEIKSFMNYL